MTLNTYSIKIRKRGQMTIPQPMREKWSTQSGDIVTLVQFDEFAVLAPMVLKTPSLARQFSELMDEDGVSLADLLEGLKEERETRYKSTRPNED